MASVRKFTALPPWAKHTRWLAVALTTSPWIVFQAMRFLPPWLMGMILLLYLILGLQVLMPQTVEVGADGVMLRTVGWRRFVPYSKIEDVEVTPLGIELVLYSGRRLEIRLTQKANAQMERVESLLSAIEDERKAAAAIRHQEEELLLARGQKDLDAWLAEMRALGEGARGGYRSLAIPQERLWEIVENPSADPSARTGAAIALHATLDDDGRARLATVAAATAAPRLRVALEGFASEKDADRVRVVLQENEAQAEEEEVVSDACRRSPSSSRRI